MRARRRHVPAHTPCAVHHPGLLSLVGHRLAVPLICTTYRNLPERGEEKVRPELADVEGGGPVRGELGVDHLPNKEGGSLAK